MEYTNRNGYLLPNMEEVKQPKMSLGTYGQERYDFLREHNTILYDWLTVEGTLYSHCQTIDRQVREQISIIMEKLMKQEKAPDKQSDPMGWTKWMNSLKAMATEQAKQLIYEM